MKSEARNKFIDIVVNVTLLVLLFLPQSNIQYVFFVGVMATCVASNFRSVRIDWLKAAIVLSLLVTFLINAATNAEGYGMSAKSVVRCVMIMLMLVFFPFLKAHKIYPATIYVAIIYLLFSQLCYFFQLTPFWMYYDSVYPYNGEIYSYTSAYLSKQYMNFMVRFGGLYHNPNQCARAYTFLLAILLIEWKSLGANTWKKVILVMLFFGVILTGSRTGLLAFLLMSAYYYYKNNDSVNKVRNVTVIALVGLVILYFYSNIEIRSVKLSEGMDDSFGSKIGFLMDYLHDETSWLYVLFGHYNMDLSNVAHYIPFGTMDAEWGFAVFAFGVVFFVLLLIYYVKVAMNFRGEYAMLNFCLIWAVSGTILFSFSASMTFFFILSIYLGRIKEIEAGNRLGSAPAMR